MNAIFQLVRSGDGSRFPAITLSRTEYARVLRDAVRDAPGMNDYLVLVLADDVNESGEFRMCTAPMMRVETFINLFGDNADVQDVPPAARGLGSGSLYQHAEG